MDIYITKDGRQLGPFSLEEVKRQRANGVIDNSDLAWHEGLAGWIPLAQISGIGLSSAPLPPNYPAPPSPGTMTGAAPTGMRLLTAAVIFVVLFIALFVLVAIIALVIGGAVSGAQAAMVQHAQGFEQGQAVGREAGQQFGKTYGPIIAGGSALFSLVVSLLVAWKMAFSNLFPWCRRR